LTIVIRLHFFKQKFKKMMREDPRTRALVEDVEAMKASGLSEEPVYSGIG
jgi:hypothetical protein